jgi:hypothetical protein
MNSSPSSLRLGLRLRAMLAALVWGIAESLALLRSVQLKRRL